MSSRDEQFNIDLFVTEQWIDPRLSFDPTLWDATQLGALRVPAHQAVEARHILLQRAQLHDERPAAHTDCPSDSSHGRATSPAPSTTASSCSSSRSTVRHCHCRRLSFAYNNMNEMQLQYATPCYNPGPVSQLRE